MAFSSEENRIFVEEENGKLLAEITFPETEPGCCCINHTFVAPSLRGQGIAGALMDKAVRQILSAGKQVTASCLYAAKALEKGKIWRKEELFAQLREMGVRPTDTVLIHTSLKAVGWLEDGALGLISVFREYLAEGLFLVPTHTWANVNRDQPCYNVGHSQPCIGAVPRAAAFHPEGIRSLHPTHSMTAFGRRAKEFTAGEEKALTPAPPEGCWGRLYDEDAKILLIGVSQNRNTYLHAVDEYLQVPDRLAAEPFTVHGLRLDGTAWVQEMRPHFCSRTKDVSQFYPAYLPAFIEDGAVAFGQLGSARVEVCSARKCRDCLVRRKLPMALELPTGGEGQG